MVKDLTQSPALFRQYIFSASVIKAQSVVRDSKFNGV